jgi:hypothetical protein
VPVPVRQTSFAGGEFAPDLWSRTELEKYASGARRLRNFVVTKRGAAASRAGTRYGGSNEADGWAWYVPFTFSETDTLVLVFTEHTLQFATSIERVPGFIESAPGVRLEVATPYAAADLPKLRWAQVGNVIRLACEGYDLHELVRTGTAPLAFLFTPVGFDIPVPNGQAFLDASVLDLVEDASHPAKQWAYQITELWHDQNGLEWETAPSPVSYVGASDGSAWSAKFMYPSGAKVSSGGGGYRSLKGANLNHAPVAGIADWDAGTTYNNGDKAGYNGQGWRSLNVGANQGHVPVEGVWWTADASVWWVADDTLATPRPVFTMAAPSNLVLFPDRIVKLWSPAVYGLTVSTGARRVARRVYRGRGSLFGYVGEYDDGAGFSDPGDLPVFALSPPQGLNPFKILDVDGNLVRTEQPGVVSYQEQHCILARTTERPGFIFVSATDDYSNYDEHVPTLAEDAFSRELAAMQREEIRALVPGRSLLAFTNNAEWALTGGGDGAPLTALSFAARPRTECGSSWVQPVKVSDDEVLFFGSEGNVVRELALDGNTAKYSAPDVTVFSAHLFEGRQIVARAWQRRPWSILWVVLDDGKLLSFSYVQEHQLRAWAWHDTQGAVESVCCVREGAEDALYVSVRRTIGGVTKRYLERMDSRLVTDATRGLFLDAAVSYDGAPATHFTGLDHLEGCTVNALADGASVIGLVVQGGAIDLPAEQFPDGASVVHVGLPYASELELLDVAQGKGKERVKTVSSVVVEFVGALGGQIGQAFDKKLETWRRRQVAHGYGPIPLEAGEVRIPITSSWNSGGRAVVRQTDPSPVTITAVVREVEYGGG